LLVLALHLFDFLVGLSKRFGVGDLGSRFVECPYIGFFDDVEFTCLSLSRCGIQERVYSFHLKLLKCVLDNAWLEILRFLVLSE
jgi:hypothetical protein